MYMPTLPAANAWLIGPHSKLVFLPIESSLHRMSCSIWRPSAVASLSTDAVVPSSDSIRPPSA